MLVDRLFAAAELHLCDRGSERRLRIVRPGLTDLLGGTQFDRPRPEATFVGFHQGSVQRLSCRSPATQTASVHGLQFRRRARLTFMT
jgi:hypothetical protein